MKVTKVKDKKTGQEGHISGVLSDELLPNIEYRARFKNGETHGYTARLMKISQLEIISSHITF